MIRKLVGILKRSKKRDEELDLINKRLDHMIATMNGEEDWFMQEVTDCVEECVRGCYLKAHEARGGPKEGLKSGVP